MKPPVGRGRIDSESGKSTAGLVWLATHRQLFKDVTRPGSVTLQFDDTGVWDPDRKVGILLSSSVLCLVAIFHNRWSCLT